MVKFRRWITEHWLLKLLMMSCLHIGRHVCQQVLETPINTAALIGTDVQMNCSLEPASGDFVEWRYFPPGMMPKGDRIYISNSPNILVPNLFEVDVNPPQYNLILKNVGPQHGYLYSCDFVINPDPIINAAQFVAVGPLSCPQSPVTVNEGDPAVLDCNTNYYGQYIDTNGVANMNPTLTWHDWNWMMMTANSRIEPNYVNTTSNFTARVDDDDKVFYCTLDFLQPTFRIGEPPMYTDSCETILYVIHNVTNIDVQPNSDMGAFDIYVGEQINCSASGRPLPTFSWVGLNNSDMVDGDLLVITSSMVTGDGLTYECVAVNEVNNVINEARKSVTFVAHVDPNTLEVSGASVEGWVIAVAVVVPIVVLATAAIIAFIIIKKRKKKSEMKSKPYDAQSVEPLTGGGGAIYHPNGSANQPKPPATYNMPASRPPPSQTQPKPRSGRDSPGYGDLGPPTMTGSTGRLNANPMVANPNPAVNLNPNGYYPTAGPRSESSVSSVSYQPSHMTGSYGRLNTSNPVPNAAVPVIPPPPGRPGSVSSSSTGAPSHNQSFGSAV